MDKNVFYILPVLRLLSMIRWSIADFICRGPWQLRPCIACIQYATDIELHVHTYAVGEADITACEGSPHNVLQSSSIIRRVIERACALLPLQCVPGLIFRASVLRPSRCVREKYGTGDEATCNHKIALYVRREGVAAYVETGSSPIVKLRWRDTNRYVYLYYM